MKVLSISARVYIALASIAALTACDQPLLAPHSRQSIRYGDFLMPIAALHIADTVTDTLTMTFDVEPGENPCAFSNYETVIATDAAYFIPFGVNHPGASCKAARMEINWYTFRPPLAGFQDTLDVSLLRVIVCQQYRAPIVKSLVFDMRRYAHAVRPMRPRNEDSIATADKMFCVAPRTRFSAARIRRDRPPNGATSRTARRPERREVPITLEVDASRERA